MNQKLILLYLIFTLSISCIAQNKLPKAEKKSGYILLFDGKTTQRCILNVLTYYNNLDQKRGKRKFKYILKGQNKRNLNL